MRFSSLIACAVAAPMLVAAAKPLRLQPSSRWIVDYADNSCRLIRTFGEGETKTILLFESVSPEQMDMVATGKPLKSNREEIGVRFLPAGKTFTGQRAITANSGDPVVLWSAVSWLPDQLAEELEREHAEREVKLNVRPPPIELVERATQESQRQQFAEKAAELEFQTRRNHPLILETDPMGGPIRAFEKCRRDSLKDWGVDPDLADKIVRPAWAPGGAMKWFSTSLSHYKAQEFNEITCGIIMKRAKFEPAELADGTKVPSVHTLNVRWELAQ